MSINFFVILFLFTILGVKSYNLRYVNQTNGLSFDNSNIEYHYCNYNYECSPHSNCEQFNSTISICHCNDKYASKNGVCNYKRKSWIIGLCLSSLNLLAPVNIFYTLEGIYSIDSFMQSIAYAHLFTCGILGYLIIVMPLSLIIFIFNKESSAIFAIVFVFFYFCFTLIWFIIDIIYFVDGKYVDANGVGLSML